MPLFSSWIYVCETGPIHLNKKLENLAHQLMRRNEHSVARTNRGGWHYKGDLFAIKARAVEEFKHHMEQHVQAFLNHIRKSPGKSDHFLIQGWMNVSKAGSYNVLHSHPGSFLSAAYYVKVPKNMKGGEIVFRDPRGPVVAMYETPGIDLPWVGSGLEIPFKPSTGKLLLFPAWLEHQVEPFRGPGERISISFNVSNERR